MPANVIVRRFDDHLPYNRLENVYEREGMRLGRSTLYGWLDQLRPLFAPLLEAMLADAKKAPYVCVDATGVLVQAPEKCARGHFWVLVAPGRHVLFAFSMRLKQASALVDRHFALCSQHDATALDGTPLRAAVTNSLNLQSALRRFLGDGHLPLTNDISERGLRTQATGRKNWLFVGSDGGATVNTTFTTLIASCRLNGIEPERYLRDVLCLLPSWPVSRVLELAPCNSQQTSQKPETQRLLDGCLIRSVILDLDRSHPPAT